MLEVKKLRALGLRNSKVERLFELSLRVRRRGKLVVKLVGSLRIWLYWRF